MDIFDLRASASNIVCNIQLSDQLPAICIAQEKVDQLSEPTSLEEIKDLLNFKDPTKIHKDIVWVEACLRNTKGIKWNSTTEVNARAIQKWAFENLFPPPIFARRSRFDSIQPMEAPLLEKMKWRLMATAGVRLLSHLHKVIPIIDEVPFIMLFTCLASFTDVRDSWTTSQAFEAASDMLAKLTSKIMVSTTKDSRGLIFTLLEDCVKPLFAKSRSTTITTSGRKAINPILGSVESHDAESELKPWKFDDGYIVTVFRWALQHVEVGIEDSWPSIIPPLLTLIDDEATDNKIKGCELLITLLESTPVSLLTRTGLGDVFQDALIPCLSYLPTLTPEVESLEILNAVYPALLCLVQARYPGEMPNKAKTRSLDKILRVGIFSGYAHAGEYVKIATLLIQKTSDLVEAMGTHSIKHLKNLILLLVGVLTAPFGTACPPLLLASAKTLQTVILNCWPRIEHYCGEILKGVTICWLNIQQDIPSEPQVITIRRALQRSIELLISSLRTGTETEATAKEVKSVLCSDPRLHGLMPK